MMNMRLKMPREPWCLAGHFFVVRYRLCVELGRVFARPGGLLLDARHGLSVLLATQQIFPAGVGRPGAPLWPQQAFLKGEHPLGGALHPDKVIEIIARQREEMFARALPDIFAATD